MIHSTGEGVSPFVWAILAATCWGLAPLTEKFGLRGAGDPSVAVFIRSLGVFLGLIVIMPFFPRISAQLKEIPPRSWVLLALGGLLASVFGQIFFYRALKTGDLSRVVPIGASYPVIAFVLGLLVFREPLTWTKAAGVSLVMTGIYLLR